MVMNNIELKKHAIFIEEQHSDFVLSKRLKNGKVKAKLRKEAENKMAQAIMNVQQYLKNNPDVDQLCMGYFSGFSYDEAFRPQYFERDFEKFILYLKEQLG